MQRDPAYLQDILTAAERILEFGTSWFMSTTESIWKPSGMSVSATCRR